MWHRNSVRQIKRRWQPGRTVNLTTKIPLVDRYLWEGILSMQVSPRFGNEAASFSEDQKWSLIEELEQPHWSNLPCKE
jgi:hypothetical protein